MTELELAVKAFKHEFRLVRAQIHLHAIEYIKARIADETMDKTYGNIALTNIFEQVLDVKLVGAREPIRKDLISVSSLARKYHVSKQKIAKAITWITTKGMDLRQPPYAELRTVDAVNQPKGHPRDVEDAYRLTPLGQKVFRESWTAYLAIFPNEELKDKKKNLTKVNGKKEKDRQGEIPFPPGHFPAHPISS